MARKTKKDKLNVRHPFTISWAPNDTTNEPVKGQKKILNSENLDKKGLNKNATLLAKDENLRSTRLSIVKSLSLASLMLALELVIYLVAK